MSSSSDWPLHCINLHLFYLSSSRHALNKFPICLDYILLTV